jgi:protein arginine kinase activator
LLLNVHGNTKHVGKHPRRTPLENETTNQVIQQRRELRDAVETEDYERASRIRDQIRTFETDVRDAAEGGKEPKSRKGGKG